MSTVKGFWLDIHTGRIYAIESTSFGKILGGVGPLDPDSLGNLDDYEYKPAINEWLEEAIEKQKLRRFNPE